MLNTRVENISTTSQVPQQQPKKTKLLAGSSGFLLVACCGTSVLPFCLRLRQCVVSWCECASLCLCVNLCGSLETCVACLYVAASADELRLFIFIVFLLFFELFPLDFCRFRGYSFGASESPTEGCKGSVGEQPAPVIYIWV